MMHIIIVMIFITFASKVTALENCDILGSLEADPLKKTGLLNLKIYNI